MANVKFAKGTTTPTYSTSGFTDGCIYFNTSTKKIYLRNSSTSAASSVITFDGNNTDTKTTYPIYDLSGSSTYRSMPLVCNIQGVGERLYSWHSMFGQGVATSANIATKSKAEGGVDAALSNYKSLPPLNTASEIVFEVDPYRLCYVANGNSSSGLSISMSDWDKYHLLHVYRTTATHISTNSSSNSAFMFEGCESHFINASNSKYQDGHLRIQLCQNGTNNMYFYFGTRGFEGNTTTMSENAYSGVYYSSQSGLVAYPDIEKHIYPIKIIY